MPIQVVAIEDQPLIHKAILQELNTQPDIQVVETAMQGPSCTTLAVQRLLREAGIESLDLFLDQLLCISL